MFWRQRKIGEYSVLLNKSKNYQLIIWIDVSTGILLMERNECRLEEEKNVFFTDIVSVNY